MSKIGGQNEVAAMSVGLTVDTAGLDASLAEARKKLDDFKQESERVPLKPTTPVNLPVDKTPPGKLPFDPLDTPVFPGAGKGPGYDIAPELDKVDSVVKKTTPSWKELSSSIGAATSGIFEFGKAITSIGGVMATFYGVSKLFYDRLSDTPRYIRDAKDAMVDFERVISLQSKTMQEAADRRLAASGVLPGQREILLNRQSGGLGKFTAATEAESANDQAGMGFLDFLSATSRQILGLVYSGPGIESDDRADRRKRILQETTRNASTQLRDANRQIDQITNDVPVSGFINTDAGLGSSVRTMSISNVRMDQRDEQARKAEYSQRQVEANRRRSP